MHRAVRFFPGQMIVQWKIFLSEAGTFLTRSKFFGQTTWWQHHEKVAESFFTLMRRQTHSPGQLLITLYRTVLRKNHEFFHWQLVLQWSKWGRYFQRSGVWELEVSKNEVIECMKQTAAFLPPPSPSTKESCSSHLNMILHLELCRCRLCSYVVC